MAQMFGLRATACLLWWKLISLFFNEWSGICDVMPALARPSRLTDVTRLSDGGYLAQRTSTKAFFYGQQIQIKDSTSGAAKTCERLDGQCGRNVAFMCNCSQSHVLVMYCHMCPARALPSTCCSSTLLFLSREDVCHCRETLWKPFHFTVIIKYTLGSVCGEISLA